VWEKEKMSMEGEKLFYLWSVVGYACIYWVSLDTSVCVCVCENMSGVRKGTDLFFFIPVIHNVLFLLIIIPVYIYFFRFSKYVRI